MKLLSKILFLWTFILIGCSEDDGLKVHKTNLILSTGSDHTCAYENQNLYCWGSNKFGQLGNNEKNRKILKFNHDLLECDRKNIKALSAGFEQTCIIVDDDRKITCWGRMSSKSSITPPTEVTGLTHIKQVGLGQYHKCALLQDETVKCWGDNRYGQLGNNSTTNSNTPSFVYKSSTDKTPLSHVKQLTVGYFHNCVIVGENRTVKCWGKNDYAQLGGGNFDRWMEKTPVDVVSLTEVSEIQSGWNHTCAIFSDEKELKCWGRNEFGQLGNNSTTSSKTPVSVFENFEALGFLKGVEKIALGDKHTCTTLKNDRIKCWGDNWFGQLGSLFPLNRVRLTPIFVDINYPGSLDLSSPIVNLIAGRNHTCVNFENGKVKCWGSNKLGQLGLENLDKSEYLYLPTKLPPFESLVTF